MNRFKRIDILRAIAVFLILGRHMMPCPPDSSALLQHVTRIWMQGGWIGVDLFFVLSGFLVSGLLFREYEKYHELRIGHFLIRRGFKIYPPFWLLIGFTVAVLLVRHEALPVRELISELLFVQNYGPSFWGYTWSLAVEEHFYLLLALGFFVLASRRRPTNPFILIPAAFVIVAVLCLMLRIIASFQAPFNLKTHFFPTHLRIDSLFFGVLLSYLFHLYPIRFLSVARRFRYVLAGAGVLMLLPAFFFPLESTPFIYTYGLTLFYLGSGCLLVAALGCQAPTTRFGNAAAYIGSHSYSVYLCHRPLAAWGVPIVSGLFAQPDNWFVYAASYLGGSIAIGVWMAILIEFPVLRIRDRFFPSRGTPLSSDVTGPNNALERTGFADTAGAQPPSTTTEVAAAVRD